MDIKRMYDMIETLTECAKHEFDKGIENIDTKEMGEVIDMIKDLAEAEYYRKISIAMDEAEYGEDYDWEGRKGYRSQPRSKTSGRYMKRGDGRRNGYEEPPYWHMTPEMYREHEPEYWRDMDKKTIGKMYYTEPNNGVENNNMRDTREGRSGVSRRGYMEAKEMNKDKGEKMKDLETYMRDLSSDVTEMISDMSAEEKNMLKSKMQVLMQKIQ